jgi:hypothetical protein
VLEVAVLAVRRGTESDAAGELAFGVVASGVAAFGVAGRVEVF